MDKKARKRRKQRTLKARVEDLERDMRKIHQAIAHIHRTILSTEQRFAGALAKKEDKR
jgi:hypothetical protein